MAGSTGRKISTFIELGGEQAFRQAMNEAARSVRVLDADMKAVSSEFKTTGDAQQYMADKSALLRSKIEQQEKIVKMLSEAVKASAGQYGEASAKTDGYRIKLSNATAKLFDMRRELETADREAEEFGRDSVKVGRQIERGIGEGAEDAQKSMKGLIEQMQADIGSIKGSVGFSVASQVTSTITNIVQSIEGFVTENADHARKLEHFRTAAELGNHDFDEMMEIVYDLTGYIGDQDAAMEAVTSLMQTGQTKEWIEIAAKQLKVLNSKYGEEAKVEAVAADLMKSVNKGKVEGVLLDLLETMGKSEDTANEVMRQAKTKETKTRVLLNYLSNGEDTRIVEEAEESMKPLSDLSKSEAELKNAQAKVAKTSAPIMTTWNKIKTGFFETIDAILTLSFGDEESVEKLKNETEKKVKELESESLEKADLGNVGKLLEIGEKKHEQKREALEWIKELTVAFWTGSVGDEGAVDASAKGTAENQVQAYVEAAEAEAERQKPTMNEIIQTLINGPGTEEENRQAAAELLRAMQPTEEEKTELYNALTSMGIDAAMLFDEAFSTSMDTAAQNAYTSGVNAGNMLNDGLNASLSGALDTAVNYASQINAALSSIGAGALDVPIYGAGYHINGASGGGIPGINFTSQIKLNGRQIAQVVDRYQGRKSSRLG